VRALVILGLTLLAPVCASRQRPSADSPTPYVRPSALRMSDAVSTATVGFVQAVFRRGEWMTAPPLVGDEMLQIQTGLTTLGGRPAPHGVPRYGRFRVVEVMEHSKLAIGPGDVIVLYQIAVRYEAGIETVAPSVTP
jgi:hypothetical protein